MIGLLLRLILPIFYNVRVEGRENIPVCGGVILLNNPVNPIGALIIESALRRKIYWAVSPAVCKTRLGRFVTRRFYRCFPLSTEHADFQGFQKAFAAIKKSNVLAFYPGGVNRGITLFCIRAGYAILPVAVSQDKVHTRNVRVAFGSVYDFHEVQNMNVDVDNIDGLMQRIAQSIEQLAG